jgi:hypothetical protein
VDGWLVIECDSHAHHSEWRRRLRDYRRDVELARQGYCVLRIVAEDILYREDDVFAGLAGLVGPGRDTDRVRNSVSPPEDARQKSVILWGSPTGRRKETEL